LGRLLSSWVTPAPRQPALQLEALAGRARAMGRLLHQALERAAEPGYCPSARSHALTHSMQPCMQCMRQEVSVFFFLFTISFLFLSFPFLFIFYFMYITPAYKL
jgi:hypothetical protein